MKILKRFSLLLIIFPLAFVTSCSEYQQVVKSDDPYLKYAKAKEYFEDEKYYKAMPLLDELISFFKGTNLMQDILYYYAFCHYETGEFLVAAYHFKTYASTYIADPRAEECLFMNAKCYYTISPNMMLEQSYSYDCVEAIQLFVNAYPDSKFVPEANQMMDDMREKLEEKAFYNANLYYKMERYKAASVAFQNLLRDFPDSKHAEVAMFMIVKANYLYAQNSISTKQRERYENTITLYQSFVSRYNQSELLSEAKTIYESSLKNLDKIKANEQNQN